MKIVQIGSFPINSCLIKGGVEASVYGLSKALSIDNEVYVFDIPRNVYSHDVIENIDGVNVYRFKTSFKSNFLSVTSIPRVVRAINSLKPDICHMHATSFFSLVLSFFFDAYKQKRVLTIHGLVHVEKKQTLKNAFSIKKLFQYCYQSITEFILISRSKLIIVDTKYVKEAVMIYKLENKITRLPRIKIIPQGINELFYKIHKPNLSKVFKIISIGAINERKGQLHLLEAFYDIHKHYSDIKLVIIGVISDFNYHKKIIDKISELQLEDKVLLLPDVENDTLINHLITSQVFALHTREESQGIVFCEAMACGLPIVTTNVGGIGDVLTNEVNGLLSDFGDIKTYKNNFIRIIEDYKLRSDMSSNNILKSQQYNWENIVLKTIDVYHSAN